MRLRFLLVALIVVIGAMGTGLYAASWTYDFGTGSTTHSSGISTTFIPNQPTGGGVHTVAVGSGGGAIYRSDPGLAAFGTNTELQIQAPTTTGSNGINKYAVSEYPASGNDARTGYMRTMFRLGNSAGGFADSGTFSYFWGDGDTKSKEDPNDPYGSIDTNNVIGTDQAFVGLRFVLGASGTITTYWMSSSAFQPVTNFTQWTAGFNFVQGQTYVLEFFASNGNGGQANSYTYNGTTTTVTTPNVDLWVNGTLIGNELPSAWTPTNNKAFDSFMWYGESSVGNAAYLFLDSMAWSNDLTTSSFTPTYTEWYSKGSGITGFTGDLFDTANWGSNPDGSGASPANFTTAGNTYYIRNYASPTIETDWTVSGTGSKVILGDDTNACNFTIPATLTMSGMIDVSNAGNLILMGANPNLTLGTLAPGSTVSYSGTVNQDVKGAAYSNLKILGSGTKTLAGATSAANPTTVGDGSLVTLLIPAAYAFTGTINVSNNGTLDIVNTIPPIIGTIAENSTVRYANDSADQIVYGDITYYTLELVHNTLKTMYGDVWVTNLVFNNGTLALATKRLTLNGKYVSFHSTDAIFTSLSVNYTDAQVAGQGVGRIWDTNGSFTNSVDVTFTFPSATAPTSLYVWYKGDSGVWTKGSAVTHSYLEGIVTITVPGITSLSGGAKGPKSWTFAEGDQTLPVELSSFTAVISSTNYVQLTWITQSETNVAGFRIYRNTTDDLATAEMLNTFIQATNTSQTQVYVYTDEEIQGDGTYYYWLQNLDLDGSFSFHGPTMVTITGHEPGIPPVPVVLGINNAWPNPFNPTLTIKYGITKNGNAALDIYNQRGQLVRNLMSGARESGSYSQVWDGRDNSGRELPSGVYFIRLQASGKTFGHKVVLLK